MNGEPIRQRRDGATLCTVNQGAGRESTFLPGADASGHDDPDLDATIDRERRRLTAYQDAAYAQRYLDLVARVRDAERRAVGPDAPLELTRQVALNYAKLLDAPADSVASLASIKFDALDLKFTRDLSSTSPNGTAVQRHIAKVEIRDLRASTRSSIWE